MDGYGRGGGGTMARRYGSAAETGESPFINHHRSRTNDSTDRPRDTIARCRTFQQKRQKSWTCSEERRL